MSRTHWFLASLSALLIAIPAEAGSIFSRKGKSDSRVRQLAETLRSEADAAKRRSAVVELKEADPRTQVDVIPALVAALQRDSAAEVRAVAAEAIGQFKQVFPVAGLALETAAESDVSPLVRDAAQQALWEYHLNGYRSARGADGIAGQTMEPPLARPPVRPASAEIEAPARSVNVTSPMALTPPPRPRPAGLPAAAPAPPTTVVSLRPDLEQELSRPISGLRVLLTAAPPLQMNVTDEPPLAAAPASKKVRTAEMGWGPRAFHPISLPLLPRAIPGR